MHTTHWTLHTAQCTLHTAPAPALLPAPVHFILHTEHSTLHTTCCIACYTFITSHCTQSKVAWVGTQDGGGKMYLHLIQFTSLLLTVVIAFFWWSLFTYSNITIYFHTYLTEINNSAVFPLSFFFTISILQIQKFPVYAGAPPPVSFPGGGGGEAGHVW